MKSFSSLPVNFSWASHFIRYGFQKHSKASPWEFLLVNDAICLVSLPPEKATPDQALKAKSPVY